MSRYVVDASVVLKWYVPEIHAAEACLYADPSHELLAPDLVVPEVGNALWKKMRRGEISRGQVETAARFLKVSSLIIAPSGSILEEAMDIASKYDRAVYDSLYLALAVARDCPLVTADRKLFNAMQPTPFARRVRWVETAP